MGPDRMAGPSLQEKPPYCSILVHTKLGTEGCGPWGQTFQFSRVTRNGFFCKNLQMLKVGKWFNFLFKKSSCRPNKTYLWAALSPRTFWLWSNCGLCSPSLPTIRNTFSHKKTKDFYTYTYRWLMKKSCEAILILHSLLFSSLFYFFIMWLSGKESTCQCRRLKRSGFNHWVGKIPWSRKWQPTLVFLPGKSHGQRSLVGYSP